MHRQDTQLDFSSQSFFIGLDVHKKSWTVTIRSNAMELKRFSMNPSPEELAEYMKKHYPKGKYFSVYESGFCGYWIHRELEALGISNIVVNAADVPTSNKEKLNKTDPVDSRKLSRELENGTLKGIYVPDKLSQELRSLSRLRSQIVKDLSRIKNRIKSYLALYGHKLPENCEMKHWSARFIEHLKNIEFEYQAGKDHLQFYIEGLTDLRQRLLRVTKQLRGYLRENGKQKDLELLMSLPGVGYITAVTILLEVIDINRFKSLDYLASYIGLVPTLRSSGDKEQTLGISIRQNKHLRALLIESAWVAVRKDPALTLSFSLLSRRMSKQQAIIRIARKLLSRLQYVWKNRTNYTYSVVK